jgi:hypothetical protein
MGCHNLFASSLLQHPAVTLAILNWRTAHVLRKVRPKCAVSLNAKARVKFAAYGAEPDGGFCAEHSDLLSARQRTQQTLVVSPAFADCDASHNEYSLTE